MRSLFFKLCFLAPGNGTGGEERKGTVCEALTEAVYVCHLSLSNVGYLGLVETQQGLEGGQKGVSERGCLVCVLKTRLGVVGWKIGSF